jgi:putative transposase
MQSWSRS